jgi:hypothetical protein
MIRYCPVEAGSRDVIDLVIGGFQDLRFGSGKVDFHAVKKGARVKPLQAKSSVKTPR